MHLGIDSSKLLLATSEEQNRGAQSQHCRGVPSRGQTTCKEGARQWPRLARLWTVTAESRACGEMSLSAAFLTHWVSFLPPEKLALQREEASCEQGSWMEGQRCSLDALPAPAPSRVLPLDRLQLPLEVL